MGWFLGVYWTLKHGELGEPRKPKPEPPEVDYWDSQLPPDEAHALEKKRLEQVEALRKWQEEN